MTPTAALNANIRAELARRDLPQSALTEPLGFTTPAAVSKRLTGDIPWTFDQLYTVAAFLNLRLVHLLPDDLAVELPDGNVR